MRRHVQHCALRAYWVLPHWGLTLDSVDSDSEQWTAVTGGNILHRILKKQTNQQSAAAEHCTAAAVRCALQGAQALLLCASPCAKPICGMHGKPGTAPIALAHLLPAGLSII